MKIRSVLLGTIISVFVILLLFLTVSVISYFTDVSASLTNILFYAGAAFGVFFGAFVAAKNCNGRVLFHSLAVSVLCLILLVVVSLTVNGKVNTDMHFLSVVLGTLFAGFLGALLGK